MLHAWIVTAAMPGMVACANEWALRRRRVARVAEGVDGTRPVEHAASRLPDGELMCTVCDSCPARLCERCVSDRSGALLIVVRGDLELSFGAPFSCLHGMLPDSDQVGGVDVAYFAALPSPTFEELRISLEPIALTDDRHW